jgi:hypothetical protein
LNQLQLNVVKAMKSIENQLEKTVIDAIEAVEERLQCYSNNMLHYIHAREFQAMKNQIQSILLDHGYPSSNRDVLDMQNQWAYCHTR